MRRCDDWLGGASTSTHSLRAGGWGRFFCDFPACQLVFLGQGGRGRFSAMVGMATRTRAVCGVGAEAWVHFVSMVGTVNSSCEQQGGALLTLAFPSACPDVGAIHYSPKVEGGGRTWTTRLVCVSRRGVFQTSPSIGSQRSMVLRHIHWPRDGPKLARSRRLEMPLVAHSPQGARVLVGHPVSFRGGLWLAGGGHKGPLSQVTVLRVVWSPPLDERSMVEGAPGNPRPCVVWGSCGLGGTWLVCVHSRFAL